MAEIGQIIFFLFGVTIVVGCALGLLAGALPNREKKGKGFSPKKAANHKIPVNEDLLTASGEQHSNKDFIPKE